LRRLRDLIGVMSVSGSVGVMSGSGLTYMYLCQVFSYPLKFYRKTGIRFRTFAQAIDRLTPSTNRS